ncbi:MAG: porin family protein [Muribaculaceae bacterium]|nr:porin family protein [Muribaculaceae bacterium]
MDTNPNPGTYLAEVRYKDHGHKGWSTGIIFNSGIPNFNQSSSSDIPDQSSSNYPSNNEDESKKPDNNGESNVMETRAKDCDIADELDSKSHHNYIPITFGITAEKRFNKWLGVESGVSYTYLHTDFEYKIFNVRCNWHYLEIPLKVNMYAFNLSHFSIYGSVSGKVSIPVYSNACVVRADIFTADKGGRFRSNHVWSAGGSIGISYRLSERINLYVEPSLQYHFRHEFKVPNLWTDDPLSFSIPIGIRFNW